MKKLLVVLMSVLLCLSLVACGSKQDNTQDTPTTPTSEYATTFTYAIGGEPDSLCPAQGSDSVSAYAVNQLYYPLFHIGPDGSMVADSVESYEVSEDGMVYTFKLVDNYWSDGQKVTAQDFVTGIKFAVGLGAADSYYSYFITDFVLNAKAHGENMDDIAAMDDMGVKAIDENTLEITLENKCPYFISLLAAGVFYPQREDYIVEHEYQWANDPAVPTNGAFHPVSVDKASKIVMAKNEYFCKADEVVLEELVALIMEDMDAQLMAFKNGEIDFASAVDATVVCNLYAGQEELQNDPSVINYFMFINNYGDNEALKDVRVRKALQLGIDRENIVLALDAGDTYYVLDGFVPSGFAGVDGDFREEAPSYVYTDKEQAKALLAEAGYGDGLTLEYYYNQSTMHDTIAAVLKSELAEIGVNLVLKTGEVRTFFADRKDGLFELARHAMSADYMDVTAYLDMALKRNQPTQIWGDDTYDALCAEANTLDGEERLAKLHEAEQYLVEEMAYVNPLIGYKNITLCRAGVTGFWTSPQANHTFWYTKAPAK